MAINPTFRHGDMALLGPYRGGYNGGGGGESPGVRTKLHKKGENVAQMGRILVQERDQRV